MAEFWVPSTKKDLVGWLGARMPVGGLRGMSKRQLYAIYFRVRRQRYGQVLERV